LKHALGPAWPDEARHVVQEPLFARMLAAAPFHGAVLNAGAGEGTFCGTIEAFPAVTRIVNVDLTAPTQILARADRRHEVLAGSLTELPFADATFDGVLCTEVLEHIPDHAKAARELARVAKKGATLLVSVPMPPAPPDENHVREGYTFDEMRALLEPAGFVVEDHAECLHDLMRALLPAWGWQARVLGRNIAPRVVVRAIAHADAALRPGKPWDLVVRARRS
jgi:SAM-dependent methyltransferase